MVVFSLTLVRHGETSFNKQNIIQGHTDVPLSKVGEEQAQLVAGRLQNERFTHIFTSDLSRASKTAKIISDRNKVCRCELKYDKRLRERKFGVAEGKTAKDLVAAAKKARRKIVDYTPPGAETLDQIRDRVRLFFSDLCQMCLDYSEIEDANYTPGKIKRRHGGSLGRNSGPNKRLGVCQRSQSFCGSGNIQNIINEMSLHAEFEDSGLNMNNDSPTYCSSQDSFTMQNLRHVNSENTVKADFNNLYHECYQSSSEECSSVIDLKSLQSQNGSISDCSSHSDSEETDLRLARSTNTYGNGLTRQSSIDIENHEPFQSENGTVFQTPNSPVSIGGEGRMVTSSSGCPNVSLSPVIHHRMSSVSSVSSGRNSSFDELDGVPLIAAEVLLVSHGGYIKELIRYFIDGLDCKIPGMKSHSLRVCPNCSISKFIVSLDEFTGKPSLTCVTIYDKDHLIDLNHTEAEGTL